MVSSGVASNILGTAYTVITSGLGGVGLLAFYQRWIVPSASMDEVKRERDEWRAAYDKEVAAHQATREAFMAASQRGDASAEAARMTVEMLRALRSEVRQEISPARDNDPGSG